MAASDTASPEITALAPAASPLHETARYLFENLIDGAVKARAARVEAGRDLYTYFQHQGIQRPFILLYRIYAENALTARVTVEEFVSLIALHTSGGPSGSLGETAAQLRRVYVSLQDAHGTVDLGRSLLPTFRLLDRPAEPLREHLLFLLSLIARGGAEGAAGGMAAATATRPLYVDPRKEPYVMLHDLVDILLWPVISGQQHDALHVRLLRLLVEAGLAAPPEDPHSRAFPNARIQVRDVPHVLFQDEQFLAVFRSACLAVLPAGARLLSFGSDAAFTGWGINVREHLLLDNLATFYLRNVLQPRLQHKALQRWKRAAGAARRAEQWRQQAAALIVRFRARKFIKAWRKAAEYGHIAPKVEALRARIMLKKYWQRWVWYHVLLTRVWALESKEDERQFARACVKAEAFAERRAEKERLQLLNMGFGALVEVWKRRQAKKKGDAHYRRRRLALAVLRLRQHRAVVVAERHARLEAAAAAERAHMHDVLSAAVMQDMEADTQVAAAAAEASRRAREAAAAAAAQERELLQRKVGVLLDKMKRKRAVQTEAFRMEEERETEAWWASQETALLAAVKQEAVRLMTGSGAGRQESMAQAQVLMQDLSERAPESDAPHPTVRDGLPWQVGFSYRSMSFVLTHTPTGRMYSWQGDAGEGIARVDFQNCMEACMENYVESKLAAVRREIPSRKAAALRQRSALDRASSGFVRILQRWFRTARRLHAWRTAARKLLLSQRRASNKRASAARALVADAVGRLWRARVARRRVLNLLRTRWLATILDTPLLPGGKRKLMYYDTYSGATSRFPPSLLLKLASTKTAGVRAPLRIGKPHKAEHQQAETPGMLLQWEEIWSDMVGPPPPSSLPAPARKAGAAVTTTSSNSNSSSMSSKAASGERLRKVLGYRCAQTGVLASRMPQYYLPCDGCGVSFAALQCTACVPASVTAAATAQHGKHSATVPPWHPQLLGEGLCVACFQRRHAPPPPRPGLPPPLVHHHSAVLMVPGPHCCSRCGFLPVSQPLKPADVLYCCPDCIPLHTVLQQLAYARERQRRWDANYAYCVRVGMSHAVASQWAGTGRLAIVRTPPAPVPTPTQTVAANASKPVEPATEPGSSGDPDATEQGGAAAAASETAAEAAAPAVQVDAGDNAPAQAPDYSWTRHLYSLDDADIAAAVAGYGSAGGSGLGAGQPPLFCLRCFRRRHTALCHWFNGFSYHARLGLELRKGYAALQAAVVPPLLPPPPSLSAAVAQAAADAAAYPLHPSQHTPVPLLATHRSPQSSIYTTPVAELEAIERAALTRRLLAPLPWPTSPPARTSPATTNSSSLAGDASSPRRLQPLPSTPTPKLSAREGNAGGSGSGRQSARLLAPLATSSSTG